MMPLYEAKMLHNFDTRWATYEPDGSSRLMTEAEKARREVPMPRYWVDEKEIETRMSRLPKSVHLLGWRDVCRSTDARTFITTRVPVGAYGHKWMLAYKTSGTTAELQTMWASLALDYVLRQKLGGTSMSYATLRQAPVLLPGFEPAGLRLRQPRSSWLGVRVDRLNAWIADAEERARVRAELDAYMFHAYGLSRSEVEYVMETFPIVKRKDEAAFGTYRTKDLILEVYDAMAQAQANGTVYESPWKVTV